MGDCITFAGGEKATDCVHMDGCITFAGGEKNTDCMYIQMTVLPLQVGRKPWTVCIWMIVLPLQVGRKPRTVCIDELLYLQVRRKLPTVHMDDCITFAGREKTTDCVYGWLYYLYRWGGNHKLCVQVIVLPSQVGRKQLTVHMDACITFAGGEKASGCVYGCWYYLCRWGDNHGLCV